MGVNTAVINIQINIDVSGFQEVVLIQDWDM